MTRFLKILLVSVCSIGLVVGAGAGLVYFVGETTPGLRTALVVTNFFVPGKLKFHHPKGKLLSSFSIEALSYQDGDLRVELHNVALKWQPLALKRHLLKVENLTLDGLYIHYKTSPGPAAFNYNDLQFLEKVFVRRAAIENFYYEQDDVKFFEMQHAKLQKDNMNQLHLIGNSMGGELRGTLSAFWKPNLSWSLQLSAVCLDLSNIQNHWPHSLSFELRNTGHLANETHLASLSADVQRIQGDLNHHPILGDIKADWNGHTLSVYPSKLIIANNNLLLFGRVAKNWDLQWKLVVPSVETFLPDGNGSLSFAGNIQGPLYQPIAAAHLQASNLYYKDNKIAAIDGNVKINLQNNVTNADLKIAELAVSKQVFKNINATVQANTQDFTQVPYQAVINIGAGKADIKGQANLKEFSTHLTLQGTDLQVLSLPEYKVTIFPDVTFEYTPQRMVLTGNVFVPKADIAPKDFSKTVSLPEDVVFVDGGKTISPMDTSHLPDMNLTVTLGDKIHIKYQSLDTKLTGKINLMSLKGNPITTSGELHTIDGSYQAYGQDLKIDEGRLLYTGGLITNPGLNIRAVRTIETIATNNVYSTQVYQGRKKIKAGVQILGTLKHPAISLFSSNGALSNKDILSYLLLGTPASEASGSQSKMLLSAASAISMGNSPGSSTLTETTNKLKKQLDLTELGVESVASFDPNNTAAGVTTNTSLVVGKKLTKKLSVHYSMGLFNQLSVLNLRYKLNKHWSLQSETSSTDNGADLLYTIELD